MCGFKLNMDGSSIGQDDIGGIGGVLRDKKGNWVLGYIGHFRETNNIRSELMALLQGLRLEKYHNLTSYEIDVDCTDLINFIFQNHIK